MLKYFIPAHIRVIGIDIMYYALVVSYQLVRFRNPKNLLKANYGLYHGGYAFASKYSIQEYVGLEHFPSTCLLIKQKTITQKREVILSFARAYGFPIILKPDSGYVGKGIFKVDSESGLERVLVKLHVDYMVQEFVPGTIEFGLFFVRTHDVVLIPSINQKFYPSITGDGISTIHQLIQKNQRIADQEELFLKNLNATEVLKQGEQKIVSFIGSNTLGSMFVDSGDLVTQALIDRLKTIFKQAPGVNFSRLDVKSESIKAFQQGNFSVIEVNGSASQPTSMLDPSHSVWDRLLICHQHALLLVQVAYEHRTQNMALMSWGAFFKSTQQLMKNVESQHNLTK